MTNAYTTTATGDIAVECRYLGQPVTTLISPSRLARMQEHTGTWCVERAHTGQLYIISVIRGTKWYLTRWLLHPVPSSLEVDHQNGDTLDNRDGNLRAVTGAMNQLNRHGANRNSRTGYRGVRRTEGGRYFGRIAVNGHYHRLGTYDTPQEAHDRVQQFLTDMGVQPARRAA